MESARNTTLGTIANGATAIVADLTSLGSAVPVNVRLTTNYLMADPPGYPARPSFTGAATPQFPHTLFSGATIAVLQCEADALIAAGAAVAA